jgi:hypothetical protein
MARLNDFHHGAYKSCNLPLCIVPSCNDVVEDHIAPTKLHHQVYNGSVIEGPLEGDNIEMVG